MVPKIWSLPARGSQVSSPALLTRDVTLQGPDTSQKFWVTCQTHQIHSDLQVFIDFFFFPVFFWPRPWGLWDLSFPTRNKTQVRAVKAPSLNHWTTRNSQDLHVFVKQFIPFIVHHSACLPGKCLFILQVQSKNNCLFGDFWVLQPSKSILGGLRNCLLRFTASWTSYPITVASEGISPVYSLFCSCSCFTLTSL